MSIPVIVLLSVIGVFAALIGFILFSPLWIRVKFREGFTVVGGISFIGFNLYPGNKSKKKAGKKNIKKAKKSEPIEQKLPKKTKVEGENEQKKKGSLLESLSLLSDILKSVTTMLGKSAKIEVDELKVVVSRPEAADTAIQFGLCSGAVSTILAFCGEFGKCKINSKNVGTSIDFLSGKSTLSADITLSARTVSVLSSLIKGYMTNVMKKK